MTLALRHLLLLGVSLLALPRPLVAPTPPPGNVPGEAYDLISMAGCKTTKSCYVAPAGCSETQNCDAIVTWKVVGSVIRIEIGGKKPGDQNRWIGIGYSNDNQMGDATVISCDTTENNGVRVRYSFNAIGVNVNQVITNPAVQNQIIVENSRYFNGYQACVFTVPIDKPANLNEPRVKPLRAGNTYIPYYLFLAWGPVSGEIRNNHGPSNRMSTSQPYALDYLFANSGNGGCNLTFGVFALLCMVVHLF